MIKSTFTILITIHFMISLLQNTYAQVEAAATTQVSNSGSGMSGVSIGVLALSAVGLVYSGMLYKAAAKQEKESEENIKKIDELMTSFKDSYANKCTNGRNDLKEPNCYCYNEDGSKNMNRSNSQTCIDSWAKRDVSFKAVAGDYLSTDGTPPDVTGCITTANKFDEGCQCKKFVDAKGNNACKKGISVALPPGLAATLDKNTALSDLMKFTNGVASGNGGNLSGASLGNKAIKTKQLTDSLFKDLSGDLKSKVPYNLDDKDALKLAAQILGNKGLDKAMSASNSNLNSNFSNSDLDPKMNEALKAASEKAGLDILGSGKGFAKKVEENKNMNFNFSDSQGGNANNSDPQFEGKKYKMNSNSDITKDTGASLFEIISHRYLESGLRKLFEEEIKK